MVAHNISLSVPPKDKGYINLKKNVLQIKNKKKVDNYSRIS